MYSSIRNDRLFSNHSSKIQNAYFCSICNVMSTVCKMFVKTYLLDFCMYPKCYKLKSMCVKQLPKSNHCLHISSILASRWRRTGLNLLSLLPSHFFQPFYLLRRLFHAGNAGLDLSFSSLCSPFNPVPYLPLVCASVFDGPWLGERQSLINWWA